MGNKLLTTVAILLCGVVAFGSCVEYGHTCDGINEKCNASKPYACLEPEPLTTPNPPETTPNPPETTPNPPENTCGCRNLDTMFYERERDTCVIQADAFGCLEYPNNGAIPVHCTLNAECNSTAINVPGTCLCIDGTSKEDHLCKSRHGGNCSANRDCYLTSTSFLSCQSSTCSCRPKSVWNDGASQCQGLVGGTCDGTNGPCSSDGMECQNGLCGCQTTHRDTLDGTCKKTLNTLCTDHAECHPDFPQCSTGDTRVCTCDEGHVLNDRNECSILVDRPCNVTDSPWTCNTYSDCVTESGASKCVCNDNYISDGSYCKGLMNANCTTSPDDCHTGSNLECKNTGHCGCKAGFKDAGDGSCLIDYNSPTTPCNNTDPATRCHPDFPVCAPYNTTVPVPVCGCEAEKLYDDASHQCRILYGKECNATEDLCYLYSQCLTSVCQCDTDYSPSGDICKGHYGASCRSLNTTNDCNLDKAFTCDHATSLCVCIPNYEHQTDGSCLGNLDAPCTEGSQCLTGQCSAEGRCGCPTGMVYDNNQCEGVYGGPCDPTCSERYGLDCSTETNTCTCAIDKHYQPNQNETRCFTGAGGTCGNIDDCVENSYCNTADTTCTCGSGFGNRDGLCVKGSGNVVQSTALFTLLSFVVAIFNFRM